MLTVITPTMWAHQPFLDNLKNLVALDAIDEIIVIDNNQAAAPTDDVLQNPKVKVHKCLKNSYVCPSWNLGVTLAKNEKLAFMADDVTVNSAVFAKMDEFLNDDVGMVMVLSPNTESTEYETFLTSNSVKIASTRVEEDVVKPKPIGMGNLFFLMKKHWLDIPAGYKILGGDNYQWNKQHSVRQNYIVYDCELTTAGPVTLGKLQEDLNTEIHDVLKSDHDEIMKMFGATEATEE